MPANNRIFYATQAIQLRPQNSDGSSVHGSWLSPKGVQSVGITTTYNLEQLFQLGQIDLYDQVEETPNVEATLNKVLDGTPILYMICMGGSSSVAGSNGSPMANLANNRVNFRLGVFADTNTAATGAPNSYVDCSGMYLSSFTYTFPVAGNATEDVTLVGNSKVWNSGGGSVFTVPGASATAFGFTGSGTSPTTIRRYNVNYSSTILPTGVGGIPIPSGRAEARPYVQSATIRADLGREAIQEFGRFAPYCRYATFPIEVTSEFQVTAADGDMVNANDFAATAGACGTSYKNSVDKQIRFVVCGATGSDTLTLDLGSKNKLTSANYTGGDTGGGNATSTYSFRTFNNFTVSASGSFANSAFLDTVDDVGLAD